MSKVFSCIVVDDEQPGRELIEAHLAQLPRFQLVASCSDAIEASQVLARHPVDLMFLDIEMPVIRGTDFYQSLSQPPAVIFTTAYRDYAVRGFYFGNEPPDFPATLYTRLGDARQAGITVDLEF